MPFLFLFWCVCIYIYIYNQNKNATAERPRTKRLMVFRSRLMQTLQMDDIMCETFS